MAKPSFLCNFQTQDVLAIGIILLVALAVSAGPETETDLKEGAPVVTTPVVATSADETAANATDADNRGCEK